MKLSHWLLCEAKNCVWSKKITPLSNLTRASLLVKSTILKENAGKVKSAFVIRAAL